MHAAVLVASLVSATSYADTLTRDNGAPVGDNQNSQTAGPDGPTLLQDVQLIQKLQRFDRERIPERGAKPGFYVVVSRTFVAENDDISTVVCAPVYSQVLGLTTEVVVGQEDGLPRTSAVRCDFLSLMFKSRLTDFVATLSSRKVRELNRALAVALDLPRESPARRP